MSAAALLGPAPADLLHVMSYNLRFPAADPGHEWEQRRPAMAELLRRERPTVLGTQEGLHDQLCDVETDLGPPYRWVGLGREGGSRGEFAAVFYDSDRLRVRAFDHFWLSDTPAAIGSRTWGNTLPRMTTWVRFADAATGLEFVVINTHFDHESEPARQRSAKLLRVTAESFEHTPVIITGDFNAGAERSDAYRLLVTESALSDTWHTARERLTPAYQTATGYRAPVDGGPRIDWIVTSPEITAETAAINTFGAPRAAGDAGRYPSDHLPVQALLRLPAH